MPRNQTVQVTCKNCGRALDEPSDLDAGERVPCPTCGSVDRHFEVTLGDGLITDSQMESGERKLPHVFISYVRENQRKVDQLCEELSKHGVRIWLDRRDIKPGARWQDEVREAIRSGNFFIACFSQEYYNRDRTFMNEEIVLAIEELRLRPTDRIWFIPVLLSECNVPVRSIGAGETLIDIQWVALYEDWDAGIKRILDVIKPIPPEIQRLIEASHSDDDEVRRSAIEALRKIGDPMAIPALINALADGNDEVCIAVVSALVNIGKPALPSLIDTLRSGNWKAREYAAYALGMIRDGFAVFALIEALHDENWQTRVNAAFALGQIGDISAAFALAEALHDESWEVREYATSALRKICTPRAICVWYGADEIVRANAASALGNLGDPKAAPALIEALKDENRYVRQIDASLLGKITHPASVPALIEALNNAISALRKIGTPEALKAVEEYEERMKGEES